MTAHSLLFDDVSLTQPLDSWRSAADDVRDAWHRCLAADRPSARAATFAAYVAALDLESTAAEALRAATRSV